MPFIQIANGLNVFYRASGGGERTILLLHGNAASSLWWERVMEILPPGYRVVAPDLPGYGDSDMPPVPRVWQQLADEVHQITEALKLQRFSLVGHSLGGSIALQVAADHPDMVERLLLINPGPAEGLQLGAEWYVRSEPLVYMPDIMKMALGAMMPTAPKDEYYARLLSESVAKSLRNWLPNTRALENTGDLPVRVGGLRAPTLIIHGTQDLLITPAMVAKLAGQIPGAVLESWPEIGHSAPVEEPARLVDRLLAFIGRSV